MKSSPQKTSPEFRTQRGVETLVVVGETERQIQTRALGADRGEARTAAEDEAEVEVLEAVVFVVVKEAEVQALADILVVTPAAAYCIGGSRRYTIDGGRWCKSG